MDADPRKWVHIAAGVRAAIEGGTLKPGDPVRVPPLVAEHDAARGTVARALGHLADDGLVRRYPGRGYVVLGRSAGGRAAGGR